MLSIFFITCFCLALLAFIVITACLTIDTYKDTVKGRYGKGDWSMMAATSIPIMLSIIALFALHYLVIKNPYWLL